MFYKVFYIYLQDDLGGYSTDLFGLLNEPALLDHELPEIFDQSQTLNTPDTEALLFSFTDSAKAASLEADTIGVIHNNQHELDHDYTARRPASVSGVSDSGISSEGHTSPPHVPSDSDIAQADSPFSSDGISQGELSPVASPDAPDMSPLGGGIEDMDIDSCLLGGADLLKILSTDSNVSVNLGTNLCSYNTMFVYQFI